MEMRIYAHNKILNNFISNLTTLTNIQYLYRYPINNLSNNKRFPVDVQLKNKRDNKFDIEAEYYMKTYIRPSYENLLEALSTI